VLDGVHDDGDADASGAGEAPEHQVEARVRQCCTLLGSIARDSFFVTNPYEVVREGFRQGAKHPMFDRGTRCLLELLLNMA
jgi:hypothetical protein